MGASTSIPTGAPGYIPGAAQPYIPSSMSSTSSILLGLFVGFLVIIVVVAAFRSMSSGKTVDAAPTPVDAKVGGTIPASAIPLNPGADYNLQFWMFVQDWDYRFGKEKEVLMRTDASNPAIVNPRITLHPTDNTLNVYLTTFTSGSTSVGRYQPGSAVGSTETGSTWLCAIENIPLQTWFSVSVTTFQRNLDVFINGNLVKSTVIPAVPRSATGNILVGANGGFSGYICGVSGSGKELKPAQARDYYAAGTSCSSLVSGSGAAGPTGTVYNLFGYTIIIEDSSGKPVTSTAVLQNFNLGSSTTSWNPFGGSSSNAPVGPVGATPATGAAAGTGATGGTGTMRSS
jgi:hypothetical protein